MLTYILRRIAWGVLVLIVVSTLTFLIGRVMPVDPARMIAGPNAPVSAVQNIREQLGLDKPIYVQYAQYLGDALQGNLGRSYRTRQEVLPTVLSRFPYTAELAVAGIFIELLVGVLLGIVAAVNRNTIVDGASIVFVLLALAVPPFWLGIMLLYVFGFLIPIFPIGGASQGILSLILPAVTVGVTGAGFYTRVSRASMLEVLNEDYVRTARAKGLPGTVVFMKHALRNAIRPIVTMAGLDLGVFMGGVLVVEQVFGWPGLGTLAWQAVLSVDLPMIMGTVLFTAFVIVLANTLVDVLYSLIDPRIALAGND